MRNGQKFVERIQKGNFKKDERDFHERLKIGNNREEEVVKMLNAHGIPAKLNNTTNVKDIDIELTYDELYVDSKYQGSEFMWAKQFADIEPENCMVINVSHVYTYAEKESVTGKTAWIAFVVDFKQFGINEYCFAPNSYLMHQIKNGAKIKDNRLNVDRSKCYSIDTFLKYIHDLRAIKYKQ